MKTVSFLCHTDFVPRSHQAHFSFFTKNTMETNFTLLWEQTSSCYFLSKNIYHLLNKIEKYYILFYVKIIYKF